MSGEIEVIDVDDAVLMENVSDEVKALVGPDLTKAYFSLFVEAGTTDMVVLVDLGNSGKFYGFARERFLEKGLAPLGENAHSDALRHVLSEPAGPEPGAFWFVATLKNSRQTHVMRLTVDVTTSNTNKNFSS